MTHEERIRAAEAKLAQAQKALGDAICRVRHAQAFLKELKRRKK